MVAKRKKGVKTTVKKSPKIMSSWKVLLCLYVLLQSINVNIQKVQGTGGGGT